MNTNTNMDTNTARDAVAADLAILTSLRMLDIHVSTSITDLTVLAPFVQPTVNLVPHTVDLVIDHLDFSPSAEVTIADNSNAAAAA